MQVTRLLIAFILTALSAATPVFAADIDPEWVTRAKQEVQPALDRYNAATLQLQESAEVRLTKDPETDLDYRNRTIRTTCAQLDNMMLFERVTIYDDSPDREVKEVTATNKEYHFTLQQRGKDAPYYLSQYKPRKPDAGMEGLSGVQFYRHAFDGLNEIIAALDQKQDYLLQTVAFDPNKQLLQIRIERKTKRKSATLVTESEFWVDPDHNWRIVEHRAKSSTGNAWTMNITYGEPINGLTYPTTVREVHTKTPESKQASYTATTTLVVKQTTKSPTDFYLAAYGVPEPGDSVVVPQNARRPIYHWLIIGSILAAVTASGLRYLAIRSRNRSQTS